MPSRGVASRRFVGTILKWSGSVIALLSLIFAAYQFYDANRLKKLEMAVAEVERFQAFAHSEDASEIAKKSLNSDTKTYNLMDFIDKKDPAFRALLKYFNILDGVAYLYNIDAIDRDYTMGNLLCPVIKQYRTFVLGETGQHGTVTVKINNSGVFKVGLFADADNLYRLWSSATYNSLTVDQRCAANWAL